MRFTFIMILALSSALFAENRVKHAIDIELNKCLSIESNMTTAGMTGCASAAYKQWDRELNIIYKKLSSRLEVQQRIRLKLSQKAWIKYRDLEFKSIDSIYDKLEGTVYIPMRVSEKIKIVRNRVLELSGHLSLLNQ